MILTRALSALAVLLGALALAVTVGALAGDKNDRVIGTGQIAFKGHGPEWWYNRAAYRYDQVTELRSKLGDRTRALSRAKRITLNSPDALTAIRIASLVYHVDRTMLVRKASCETGGTFDERAQNSRSTAAGLFQFLDSTWASTPFAHENVYDGYINALAAGWMHAEGRGGEWECQ